MYRLILLTLLTLMALPLRADQAELIAMTPQAIRERLGDTPQWHLAQLNTDSYVYSPQSEVFTLENGHFVLPTPCGIATVPPDPQRDDLAPDDGAVAQPCIAIHVTTYDVIYIMAGSDTAQRAANGSLTFRNERGLVVLAPVLEN